MAQELRVLTALPEVLTELNSEQPHGGSLQYVMRSGALFWTSGIHAGRTLYVINKF